jgi:hypothetical protein
MGKGHVEALTLVGPQSSAHQKSMDQSSKAPTRHTHTHTHTHTHKAPTSLCHAPQP